ncbi:MAG: hypothetical protein ACK5MP_04370 [Nostocoides sp.]
MGTNTDASPLPTLTVPARFNGPPESGNGGWVCGSVAAFVADDGPVTVRLSSPPPLETTMTVHRDPHRTTACDVYAGNVLVATAATAGPGALDELPMAPVDGRVARAAEGAYEGLTNHPFPTCFVCGTHRADGLGLRPGPIAGDRERYAAAWQPTEMDPRLLWAALDCPGAWAVGIAGRAMVLGTMTARITRLPQVGEDCVVMAWPRGGSGRKYFSGTALYGEDGTLAGHAESTWIVVDPSQVRPG